MRANKWLCLALLNLLPLSALSASENMMDEKMKTWCFGRFLVDMPLEAGTPKVYSEYLGKEIKAEKVTREEFQEKVNKSVVKLKNVVGLYSYDKEVAIDPDCRVVIGYRGDPQNVTYSINTFKFDQGWVFSTSGSPYGRKVIDEMIERFTRFVQTVRYRPEGEIPKEPGICLEHGFIANGENTEVAEETSLQFKLKDHPDIRIVVQSMVSFREWPTLLEKERASGVRRFSELMIIRSGKRTINGMPGEESLLAFPSEAPPNIAQNFAWETRGEVNNPDKPLIRVTIYTGRGVYGVIGASSMETDELVKLYDSIVKTIRIRPVEEPKPQAPPPLSTGDKCPRAGLWRCLEDGQVRTLVVGQHMSTANFYKPATGWLNWIRGIKTVFSHQGPAHWVWVGEEPAEEPQSNSEDGAA